MYNAEHYPDPTASVAVRHTLDSEGIKTFIPKPVFIAKGKGDPIRIPEDIPISKMTMEEITPGLRACIKCYGDPMKCVDCANRCKYGERAVEILEEDTKPEAKELNISKPIELRKNSSLDEYKKAIASGDVFQYALEHAQSRKSDLRTRKRAAYARVSYWRKHFGHLVSEHSVQDDKVLKTEMVCEPLVQEPHLKQMPCLSRKVIEEEAHIGDMAAAFRLKLDALYEASSQSKAAMDSLAKQLEEINEQIRAVKTTASIMDISL